jgi:hypothetical protein
MARIAATLCPGVTVKYSELFAGRNGFDDVAVCAPSPMATWQAELATTLT